MCGARSLHSKPQVHDQPECGPGPGQTGRFGELAVPGGSFLALKSSAKGQLGRRGIQERSVLVSCWPPGCERSNRAPEVSELGSRVFTAVAWVRKYPILKFSRKKLGPGTFQGPPWGWGCMGGYQGGN